MKRNDTRAIAIEISTRRLSEMPGYRPIITLSFADRF